MKTIFTQKMTKGEYLSLYYSNRYIAKEVIKHSGIIMFCYFQGIATVEIYNMEGY